MTIGLNEPNDQWLQMQLKLRADLVFEARKIKSRRVILIEDKINSKFYQLGELEHLLIKLLDGQRTIEQANTELALLSDQGSLENTQLKKLFDWLIRTNLVETGSMAHLERFEKSAEAQRRRKVSQFVNPFYLRFPLVHPDKFLQRMLPVFGWLFSRWGFALWATLITFAGYQLVDHWVQFQSSATGILSGYRWVWLGIAAVALKIIHECGHGLACKKFGADVRDSGIVMMCFMPMAYIDVTSCWRLQNKWQRIIISLGGMFFETIIASTSLIIWSLNPTSIVGDFCYNLALMSSITTLLFNANPLMRFDGYFVLSDLFGSPNMYQRAGQLLNRTIKEALITGKREDPIRWNKSNLTLLFYGMATFVWRILICVGLVLTASFMFYGAGVVLAIVGIVLWTMKPVAAAIRALKDNNTFAQLNRVRCVIAATACLLLTITICGFLFRPATITAPGIVEYRPLTVVRANGAGFLSELRVAEGDFVSTGDIIAVMVNDELEVRLEKLEHELQQSRIRAAKHRQLGEFSNSQAEDEQVASLKERVSELQHQVNSMVVRAPGDGYVVRRGWNDMKGTYMNVGDELVVVGCTSAKELQVSIDQSDVNGLEGPDCQYTARVQIAGSETFDSLITRIEPQASLKPLHSSLCAGSGGSLPVRMKSADNRESAAESGYELLVPRFTATLKLSEELSQRFRTGQRVEIRTLSPTKTVALQFYEGCRNWLRDKIELAAGATS